MQKQTSQSKCAFCADFSNWLSSPFSVDMPATDWFLFIGFLLVLVILWKLILNTVEEAL